MVKPNLHVGFPDNRFGNIAPIWWFPLLLFHTTHYSSTFRVLSNVFSDDGVPVMDEGM